MKYFQRAWFVLLTATLGVSAAPLRFDVPPPRGPYYGVFRDLPITEITPQGWLADFLCRQRDGLGAHYEVGGPPFTTCMWTGKIPHCHSWSDYEQSAYLTDGLYRAGLLLNDARLIKLGQDSIDFTLTHPQADGKIGPGPADFGAVDPHDIGTPVWPLAVFTRVLMANYAVTGNAAILDGLTRTYLSFPEDFGRPAKGGRNVDTVEGMCWTYGQTGDQRLIALAERTWDNFAPHPRGEFSLARMSEAGPMKGHGVSICEATKQPALLYLYTGRKEYLDAALGAYQSLERDHELVDGVITSDEGLHGKTAEGLHETCDISDYTWSIGYLLQASGDAKWGDKIERAVFNAGFGAIDKEFKAHQYFSSPNQVVSNQHTSAAPFGPAHEDRQAYRAGFATQCCTGNVHRFLPNYATRMWMSGNQGGIAAVFYGPSTLRHRTGAEKVPVTIVERTDYPFDGRIELTITTEKPVAFPLYVRIPAWAEGSTVTINDKASAEKPEAGKFLKLNRTFATGDVVKLNFPMRLREEMPVANGMSLLRGPLVYSLKIKEDKTALTDVVRASKEMPAWDISSRSPWNYALAIDVPQDLAKVRVESHPVTGFPWTQENVPVILTVPAHRIPSWTLTPEGKNPPLPNSPFTVALQTEDVQLVPEGATQLRISVFPSTPAVATSKPGP